MAKLSRTFRLEQDLVERFDKAADLMGVDKTSVVDEAIGKFVSSVEAKGSKEQNRTIYEKKAKSIGYFKLSDVYIPFLGKCSCDSLIEVTESDIVNAGVSVMRIERKDDEGTRFNISPYINIEVDFNNMTLSGGYHKDWIGGLVEYTKFHHAISQIHYYERSKYDEDYIFDIVCSNDTKKTEGKTHDKRI
jgi:hypothetical protein